MGNVIGKKDDEIIDGGYAFPTGTVYQKTDCDLRIVRKLVLEQRLSPFYKGNADELPNESIECPICFLNYPLNLNISRCCSQQICTECFVQIQQPKTGGPAVCPFCVQVDYGILYSPPTPKHADSSLVEKKERKEKEPQKFKPVPANSSLVITIDIIRPNGRHYPTPPEQEPPTLRRMTISGRTTRPINQRRSQFTSSSFSSEGNIGYRSMRQSSPSHRMLNNDVESELENLMLMEAIHQSLLEQERRDKQNKEAQADRRNTSHESTEPKRSTPSHWPVNNIFDLDFDDMSIGSSSQTNVRTSRPQRNHQNDNNCGPATIEDDQLNLSSFISQQNGNRTSGSTSTLRSDQSISNKSGEINLDHDLHEVVAAD